MDGVYLPRERAVDVPPNFVAKPRREPPGGPPPQPKKPKKHRLPRLKIRFTRKKRSAQVDWPEEALEAAPSADQPGPAEPVPHLLSADSLAHGARAPRLFPAFRPEEPARRWSERADDVTSSGLGSSWETGLSVCSEAGGVARHPSFRQSVRRFLRPFRAHEPPSGEGPRRSASCPCLLTCGAEDQLSGEAPPSSPCRTTETERAASSSESKPVAGSSEPESATNSGSVAGAVAGSSDVAERPDSGVEPEPAAGSSEPRPVSVSTSNEVETASGGSSLAEPAAGSSVQRIFGSQLAHHRPVVAGIQHYWRVRHEQERLGLLHVHEASLSFEQLPRNIQPFVLYHRPLVTEIKNYWKDKRKALQRSARYSAPAISHRVFDAAETCRIHGAAVEDSIPEEARYDPVLEEAVSEVAEEAASAVTAAAVSEDVPEVVGVIRRSPSPPPAERQTRSTEAETPSPSPSSSPSPSPESDHCEPPGLNTAEATRRPEEELAAQPTLVDLDGVGPLVDFDYLLPHVTRSRPAPPRRCRSFTAGRGRAPAGPAAARSHSDLSRETAVQSDPDPATSGDAVTEKPAAPDNESGVSDECGDQPQRPDQGRPVFSEESTFASSKSFWQSLQDLRPIQENERLLKRVSFREKEIKAKKDPLSIFFRHLLHKSESINIAATHGKTQQDKPPHHTVLPVVPKRRKHVMSLPNVVAKVKPEHNPRLAVTPPSQPDPLGVSMEATADKAGASVNRLKQLLSPRPVQPVAPFHLQRQTTPTGSSRRFIRPGVVRQLQAQFENLARQH